LRIGGLFAVFACIGFVFAWPMQGVGYNQNAHYALVKALSDGTAVIDDKLGELGELSTRDISRYRGHFYSNKAPGLAFLTVPMYTVLDRAGARTTGDPTQMLWALGLIGVVVPAVALLWLVRSVAERLEPGFGLATAVALGLGTLLLPFATLFFSHVLSAFVVFAAFALLFHERDGRPRLVLVAAAGLLAGFSGVVEYPNAFAAAVLGVYAIARTGWPARALAYGAGVLVGISPLLAYNYWAFGSVVHLSYAGSLSDGAVQPQEAVLGAVPDPLVVLESLFGRSGLITLSPVLALGAVGAVLLYRRGWQAEAAVIAALATLYVSYNASFGSNFGGYSAGQRYLLAIVPFLAFPLALSFRALPATTGGLAAVSTVVALAITSTHALAGYDAEWFRRIGDLQFVPTAASLVDVTGWYTILPFFAAAATAAGLALLETARPHWFPAESALAGLAVLAWALLAAGAPKVPALGGDSDELASYMPAAASVVVVAAAVALVLQMHPGGNRPARLGRPRATIVPR
jgi:hypothetical protein